MHKPKTTYSYAILYSLFYENLHDFTKQSFIFRAAIRTYEAFQISYCYTMVDCLLSGHSLANLLYTLSDRLS